MMAKANPILDALFQPQQLDMGKVAHAIAPSQEHCRAEKIAACGASAVSLRLVGNLAFPATDCSLSSAAENARYVRKNPKDFGLEKLRSGQVVERQAICADSGPRWHEDRVPDGTGVAIP